MAVYTYTKSKHWYKETTFYHSSAPNNKIVYVGDRQNLIGDILLCDAGVFNYALPSLRWALSSTNILPISCSRIVPISASDK